MLEWKYSGNGSGSVREVETAIGESIFLTPEEAEAKLKEMERKNNE